MNNLKSLKLNDKIYQSVLVISKKLKVDLNTVDKLTSTCIRVGEPRTGLIILIRENKEGVLIEGFQGEKISDLVIESELLKGVYLDNHKTQSKIVNSIVINTYENGNGYFLSRNGQADSPLNLIGCSIARNKVMQEAEKLVVAKKGIK